MALTLTDANFQEEIIDNKGLSIIDFWAEWCGPCRLIGPIVEQIGEDYEGRVKVGKLDVDANPEVSMKYGIRSIPTLLFIKDGEIVDKHIGTSTKARLEAKIEPYL